MTARSVASFSCSGCQAQDEVLEPAPECVPCWGCKGGTMDRWTPKFAPPKVNARAWDGKARAR